jgi:hypothetical protein
VENFQIHRCFKKGFPPVKDFALSMCLENDQFVCFLQNFAENGEFSILMDGDAVASVSMANLIISHR